MGIFQGALIETLVSNGFSKKAEKLNSKLDKFQSNIVKQQSKLNVNISRGASKRTIANRLDKINDLEKEALILIGITTSISTTKEIIGKGGNKANEERIKQQ